MLHFSSFSESILICATISADWALDFTVPTSAIPTSYGGPGSPMVSSSNRMDVRATLPGVWNWSFWSWGYNVAAAKAIPTSLYSRPSAPRPQYKAGIQFRSIGNAECPQDHPHIPFSYFAPYPAVKKLEDLGRTPLRPPASWFFPMQLPQSYPVSPMNAVLPPASEFSVETNLIAIREPPLEKAIQQLQLASERFEEDAAVCKLLISAIRELPNQSFGANPAVRSQVEQFVSAQTLNATSDGAMLNSEATNRAGAGSPQQPPVPVPVAEDPVPILSEGHGSSSTSSSLPPPDETSTAIIVVSEPTQSSGSFSELDVDSDEESSKPEDTSSQPTGSSLEQPEEAQPTLTNQSESENVPVVTTNRISMSLRKSLKLVNSGAVNSEKQ